LEEAEVAEWLDTDLAGDIVDNEARHNNEEPGNTGVPRYIIQRAHRLDGAEDPSAFIEVFAKIKEDKTEA
jgi:predicted DsbA family dithiol-disulfide isomerase